MKEIARVRLSAGRIRLAELHWYEAYGIGKKEIEREKISGIGYEKTRPIRHWRDSKIRCHLFSCVVALAYLRRLELKLAAAGIKRTAEDIMDDMRHLHSVLLEALIR